MNHQRIPQSQRGSVLIVALLICAIIGISLVSYYKLAANTLKGATRSFLALSNVDLAEIGIEQAMACFYTQSTGTASATAWSGWTLSGATATRTFSGFTPAPNSTATVRVYVNNYTNTSGTPVIVSKATSTPPSGAPIDKFVEVTLTGRSVFTMGLIAVNNVTWVGHPEADSWNSDPDNNSATAAIPYSLAVRNANCVVGSITGSIALGSGGDVFGFAKTSTSGTTSGGSVHATGTTVNDTTRIANDFAAAIPTITLPTPNVTNVLATVPTTLPGVGHIAASDGRYYYTWGTTLGGITANTTIAGNVTITMTGRAGSDAIRLTGNKVMTINSGSSLNLYTDGNISANGNGIANTTTAAMCQIYGTGTSSGSQTISVGGNGVLIALICAPNAAVELKGGGSSGEMVGCVIGKTITMNGGTNFHYDESLANLTAAAGVSVSKWKELQSASERSTYTSVLNF